MRVLVKKTLRAFGRKHPDADQPLRVWHKEIQAARFENPAQLRQQFGGSDFVQDKVIFDIGGNKYRLIVRIRYAVQRPTPLNGLVLVLFIGTHAQYNRLNVNEL